MLHSRIRQAKGKYCLQMSVLTFNLIGFCEVYFLQKIYVEKAEWLTIHRSREVKVLRPNITIYFM